MEVWGALHSHPNADVEKGSNEINKMYFDALGKLPYITGGKSGEAVLMEERKAAVEEFMKMRRKTLKMD